MPSGETQQPAGEICCPLSCQPDLLDCFPRRVFPSEKRRQQTTVAIDHGQQIVEVVRNASRYLPDRLELLRLVQLTPKYGLLVHETRARRHIPDYAEQRRRT